jgi:hypothetical protein
MLSIFSLILSLSSFLVAVLAIPNVTVVPLTGTCADYPSYDASTGLSGQFLLTLNSCDNSTIEGYGDTCQVIRQAGVTGIYEGRVTDSDKPFKATQALYS